MTATRAGVFVTALLLAASPIPAVEWKPAQGPLATPWAKDVTPDNVLPGYPRPQRVRKDWLNLNGLWDYAIRPVGDSRPEVFDGQILVPFPIESALSGVMKPVSEKQKLWYHRTFTVTKDWAGKRLLLQFGAVDWEAAVYVNGKPVGRHRGGYDPFAFDITEAVKADGPQELLVEVFDPTDKGNQPRGKQVLKPGGIMYTASTGIWQTVWIEPVAATYIGDMVITPDVDGRCLRLTVNPGGDAADATVEAVALMSGTKDVGRAAGKASQELKIPLADLRLWSPDDPFLYDLKVELKVGGKTVDAISSYFGMRKIELARDEKGILRPRLNGKFVMQVGLLDQGFWPDGLYTPPAGAAMYHDIYLMKLLGMNMVRKHVKVEPEEWYYLCDTLGLLVWQDMPSGNNVGPEARRQFEQELKALVETHRNHPAIIMWVIFNEGWGQYETPRLTAWVKEMDPSRLVDNATGWTDAKVGDVIDIHAYPGPDSPKPEAKRAAVLGEFGGLGLGLDGHTWKKEHWGYKGMADSEDLTAQYELLLKKVYQLRDDPGLSAVVYTQFTDVEVECNGLVTYDRAVVKPALPRVAAVNRGDFRQMPPPPIVRPIVATPRRWPPNGAPRPTSPPTAGRRPISTMPHGRRAPAASAPGARPAPSSAPSGRPPTSGFAAR
jgi:hypothetical protein